MNSLLLPTSPNTSFIYNFCFVNISSDIFLTCPYHHNIVPPRIFVLYSLHLISHAFRYPSLITEDRSDTALTLSINYLRTGDMWLFRADFLVKVKKVLFRFQSQ